jgi:hypothetical protein
MDGIFFFVNIHQAATVAEDLIHIAGEFPMFDGRLSGRKTQRFSILHDSQRFFEDTAVLQHLDRVRIGLSIAIVNPRYPAIKNFQQATWKIVEGIYDVVVATLGAEVFDAQTSPEKPVEIFL